MQSTAIACKAFFDQHCLDFALFVYKSLLLTTSSAVRPKLAYKPVEIHINALETVPPPLTMGE